MKGKIAKNETENWSENGRKLSILIGRLTRRKA